MVIVLASCSLQLSFYFPKSFTFWIIFSKNEISGSVSLVSSVSCVCNSLISVSTSAITPLFSTTALLPVTIGTTHESIDPVIASLITELASTTPVDSIHVNSVHVNSVHSTDCASPVEISGIVGPLIVQPVKLATVSSNPATYTFFIFLFKI